ncbi:MAG: sigma 54-interacting transcriptional regulator [Thermoanaerobaculia bacterium]
MKASKILLVDDDSAIRMAIHDYLEVQGFDVQEAANLSELRVRLRTARPDAIVLDYMLAHETSLEIVPEIKAVHPDLPIIILTGHGSIDLAVTAIKAGADQFMTKPVQLDALHVMLERLLSSRRAVKRDTATRARIAAKTPDPFIGVSEAMQRLRRDAERVATTERPLLIQGETGAGKGVLAAWLHRSGARVEEAMVELNCAAVARELIDSELFGHERGAFTGAVTAKQGLFEVADGGTLFLDEIGDMPFDLQTRLLRVLADGQFYRVGGHNPMKSNVRVIAATHQDLEQRVKAGAFREDLFHRLNVIRLRLPALRERTEDIAPLARFFLQKSARELGVEGKRLTEAAIARLVVFDFPGNVRQLENICHWLTVMAPAQLVDAKDLPPELQPQSGEAVQRGAVVATGAAVENRAEGAAPAAAPAPAAAALAGDAPGLPAGDPGWLNGLEQRARELLHSGQPMVWDTLTREFEAQLIRSALELTRGRRIEAAHKLGIGRNTITRKIQELGLDDK